MGKKLAAAVVILVAAWLGLRHTYYTARAPLLVDVRQADPVAGQAQPYMAGMVAPSFMATQIEEMEEVPAEMEPPPPEARKTMREALRWLRQELVSGRMQIAGAVLNQRRLRIPERLYNVS